MLGAGPALAQDRDCPDFPSQRAAQRVLEADPSDPERLDRDKDGIACETFFRGGSRLPRDTPENRKKDKGNTGKKPEKATGPRKAKAEKGKPEEGKPQKQVAQMPAGGVETGSDGTGDVEAPALLALGGLALLSAGGLTVAVRRRS